MTLDLNAIQMATLYAQRHIEGTRKRLARAEIDDGRVARLAQRECVVCFYMRGGLAGQAFTDWKCNACGVDGNYPNTAVPRFCNACSDKFEICVRCGGDIELRQRRSVQPPKTRKP